MGIPEDIQLRLSAQRALLTNVTPRLRAVSLDIDTEQYRIWVRFIFDGQPSETVKDTAGCIGAEILSDYPEGWNFTEEVILCCLPDKMEHLRLLVYHRCEDSWVLDDYPGEVR